MVSPPITSLQRLRSLRGVLLISTRTAVATRHVPQNVTSFRFVEICLMAQNMARVAGRSLCSSGRLFCCFGEDCPWNAHQVSLEGGVLDGTSSRAPSPSLCSWTSTSGFLCRAHRWTVVTSSRRRTPPLEDALFLPAKVRHPLRMMYFHGIAFSVLFQSTYVFMFKMS